MKKEQEKQQTPAVPPIEVETIPTSFYGGENPAVYEDAGMNQPSMQHEMPKKEVKEEKKPEPEVVRPMLSQEGGTSLSASQPTSPSQMGAGQGMQKPKSALPLVMLLIVAVLVLGGSAAAYYFLVLSPQNNSPVDIPSVQEVPTIPEPVIDAPVFTPPTTTTEVVTTTPDEVVETPEEPVSRALVFPSTLFTKGTDTDGDGLSDLEEQLFLTSASSTDSDADGYLDTTEIENLYNPKGFAPIKLVDSGLVKEFTDPLLGYRTYFPASWSVSPVDAEGLTQLFSTLSNQFVEISVFPKEEGQTFISWFVTYAQDEVLTNYSIRKNRFETSYYVRNDGLAVLFDTDTAVYALIYKNDENESVEYANVLSLMAQSFRIDQDAQFPLTQGQTNDIATLPTASSTGDIPAETTGTPDILAPTTTLEDVTSTLGQVAQ